MEDILGCFWDRSIIDVLVFYYISPSIDHALDNWERGVMPKFDNYYIVEYRYAIRIDDTATVMEAMSKANRICERQHGFKPDNWYARIFEYSVGEKVIGHVKEYFYNPNSATSREITKNIGHHNDLVSRGEVPADIIELNKKMIEEDQEID